MGWSAGLTFCTEGGAGILRPAAHHGGDGGLRVFRDAASILRSSTNCMVMLVLPRTLEEVIESRPGTVENWRSRMVAHGSGHGLPGLAPGRLAWTWRVGKSMLREIADGELAIAGDAKQQDPHHDQSGHHRTRRINSSVMFKKTGPPPPEGLSYQGAGGLLPQ